MHKQLGAKSPQYRRAAVERAAEIAAAKAVIESRFRLNQASVTRNQVGVKYAGGPTQRHPVRTRRKTKR